MVMAASTASFSLFKLRCSLEQPWLAWLFCIQVKELSQKEAAMESLSQKVSFYKQGGMNLNGSQTEGPLLSMGNDFGIIPSFKLDAQKITIWGSWFCVCECVFCFNHAFVGFFYESVLSLKSVRAGWIAEELVLQRLGSDKVPGLRSMI